MATFEEQRHRWRCRCFFLRFANFSFEIAKFVAIIALVLFVISLVANGMRGRGGRV